MENPQYQTIPSTPAEALLRIISALGLTVTDDARLVTPIGRILRVRFNAGKQTEIGSELRALHSIDGDLEVTLMMTELILKNLFEETDCRAVGP